MSKYLIAIILKKFGINFFSVVKNDFLAIQIAEVKIDQCALLLKYAHCLAMFNPIMRLAGFTHSWLDDKYPEGYSKKQWKFHQP